MSCAEYWESQGVDALDAMFSMGCPAQSFTMATATGHDVIGGLIFLASIIAACVLANRNTLQPVSKTSKDSASSEI
jgi:hypothetical protein